MEISQQKVGNELHLTVSGRLDGTWSGALEKELTDAISGGSHQIRLDLAQVQFISSAGIRVLLRAMKELAAVHGSLAVTAASDNVHSVLNLTGLTKALEQSGKERKAAPAAGSRSIHHESMDLKIFSLQPRQPIVLRLMGDPKSIAGGYSPAGITTLPLRPDTMAIGIGAFGSEDDCRKRFGECLAVCGAATYLPAEKAAVPDFLLATSAFTPEIKFLYGLSWPADFVHLLRFESRGPRAVISLSELAGLAFEIAGRQTVALGMIAETAGLIGIALKRPPPALSQPAVSLSKGLADDAKTDFYEYPEIKNRFSFAPEPVFGRTLTLTAGIASRDDKAELAGWLRPLDPGRRTAGHFHSAVFDRRPLKQGLIALEDSVHNLFQQDTPRSIMHLLTDRREVTGAGESSFIRGALWIGPVEKAVKE